MTTMFRISNTGLYVRSPLMSRKGPLWRREPFQWQLCCNQVPVPKMHVVTSVTNSRKKTELLEDHGSTSNEIKLIYQFLGSDKSCVTEPDPPVLTED